MRLKIDNFAKIKHAEITIDGITVIAGENNTGKSTIGKVLYSAFNAFYDMDLKIENRRRDEILEIIRRGVRNALMHSMPGTRNSGSLRMTSDRIARAMSSKLVETEGDILDEVLFRDYLEQACARYDVQLTEENMSELLEDTYEKIVARKRNDDYKVALELIERFFIQVFGEQVKCLRSSGKDTKVSLDIKGKELSVLFRGNQCVQWQADYNILHEAFFIDDPFVLDQVSNHLWLYIGNGYRKGLLNRLNETDDDIMDGIFEAVSAKENLKEIYDILKRVADGQILVQNGQWSLHSEKFEEPIHFENLSAGLKSFVLLKLLLEKGILKEKDVLILDEPEIHLHPEWQLVYAEMIVLLQEKFDLSIVVTTHSRDFLEAIELYAKKYELFPKCRFYLSGQEEGLSVFEDVTECLDKIYGQLVTPSMLLDNLRYEIGTEEDE